MGPIARRSHAHVKGEHGFREQNFSVVGQKRRFLAKALGGQRLNLAFLPISMWPERLVCLAQTGVVPGHSAQASPRI